METRLPRNVSELTEAMADMEEFKNMSYRSSMENYMETMEELDSLYSVEKYDVVFIGEPGMGKTTTICTWLGLVRKDPAGLKTPESAMLLSVRQGRTTVAEVRIRQVEGHSRMLFEYGSIEAQTAMIRNYCKYYYEKFIPAEPEEEDGEDSEAEEDVHSEVDRVIRNMAKLSSIPSEENKKFVEIKECLEGLGSLDAFVEKVLERIDLESRDLSEIDYDGSVGFEDWLSDTFEEVNNGKNPRCAIADTITIEIGKEDFDLRLPDYIGDVVDTKGLDTSARMDLQDLMTADDTVCILMDRINNTPSKVNRSLLKKAYLGEEYSSYAMKTLLFVRATEEELAAVNEAEGDPELGKEKKLAEIDRKTEAERVLLYGRNVSFLDSHSPFETRTEFERDETGKLRKKTVITGYNDFIADVFREQIEGGISSAIGFLRGSLEEEADQIRENVEALMDLEEDYENTCGAEELDEIC